MDSVKKIVSVVLVATILASSEAGSVRGRYVWKKLTTASDGSSLSMGIHVPI